MRRECPARKIFAWNGAEAWLTGRGTRTVGAGGFRSRTFTKRGASDGPLGATEAWTTSHELNRAAKSQPKFEIASGAGNAKIEVGSHRFASQRPNA